MATLAELRTRARQLADQELRTGQDESTHFINNTVATQFVNDAISAVYRILVQANPDEFVQPDTAFQATSGTYEYDLPADFYKLRGVEKRVDANDDRWIVVKKANFGERNKAGLKYRRRGSKIRFMSNPGSDYYRVWYIPAPTILSGDSDTYDGSVESEPLVVAWAAKLMKVKAEDPIDELLMEIGDLRKELTDSESADDMGTPDTITDSTGDDYLDRDFDDYV